MTLTTPRPFSLSVPCTQNTAPILEFRCLYTHDIRRKSKRWQDGFLRFHTFNKRVMVYDLPRNFVGDSHWRETTELTDGDEFELERHGILVQVGEALGKTEQDLSVLFEKRARDREQKLQAVNQFKTPLRDSGAVAARAFSPPIGRTPNPTHPSNDRTLKSILGTPSHSLGQANWPGKSPFEQRHGQNEGDPKERSSKRRKVQDNNESLPSNPTPQQDVEIQEKATRKNRRRKAVRTNGGLGSIVIVDVSDDERTSHDHSNTSEQLEEPNDVVAEVRPTEVRPIHNQRANELLQKSANPLRLAGRPARKKLLCQDISSPTRPTANSHPVNYPPQPRRQSPSPPPSPESEGLIQFHQAQTERLQARMKRHNNNEEKNGPSLHGREQEKAPPPPLNKPYQPVANKRPEAPHGQQRKALISRENSTRLQQFQPQQPTTLPNPVKASMQQQKQKTIAQQRPTNAAPRSISRQGSMNHPPEQTAGRAGPIGAWSLEVCDLFDWRRPTSSSSTILAAADVTR